MKYVTGKICAARDHPREYGENGVPGEVDDKVLGTIPANTGRIITPENAEMNPRDHPREYGEN